jgi:HPt (histidine-containing phosphotransfer) domain-containing protein
LSDTPKVAVDPDILDLAETFLRKRRGQIQDWRKAIADGDEQALRRLGHELKGTAGSFGFHDLSGMAAELEAAVIGGDLATAAEKLERMIDFLDRVDLVPR